MKIAQQNGQAEIFYSIQGEGKSLGRPSIFVRTSLCNLHCVWCDTDYTWNWEGTRFRHVKDAEASYQKYKMQEQILEMSVQEVVNTVRKFSCKNIILTGGEPLMQQADLLQLMRRLRMLDKDYRFEIETNGTYKSNLAFDKLVAQYNVSPKLASSGNTLSLREKSKVLQYFVQNEKTFFKFVIVQKSDVKALLKLIKMHNIPAQRVYLMPEGTLPEQINHKQPWLVELCLQHGFHFSSRLHVQIWGDKRGV